MQRVGWWAPIHYEVMEFFENHDIAIRPASLARNVDYTPNYVGKTCRELVQQGLLSRSESFYTLTEDGRAFIRGELPAADLPGKPD